MKAGGCLIGKMCLVIQKGKKYKEGAKVTFCVGAVGVGKILNVSLFRRNWKEKVVSEKGKVVKKQRQSRTLVLTV